MRGLLRYAPCNAALLLVFVIANPKDEAIQKKPKRNSQNYFPRTLILPI
jgi:hypothetical protein